MATAAGDVFKEFQALARNIDKLSDGQAQVMFDDEWENEDGTTITFLLSVSPNDGHYKGATVKFRVRVTSEYPTEAPEVTCLNSVYHPNIDLSFDGKPSSICVNLIGEDWEPEVGLDGCVIAVLFLFHHPNQDDALSTAFSGSAIDEDEFATNVKASIKGEDVEEYSFDKLVKEDSNKNEHEDNVPKSNEEASNADALPTEERDIYMSVKDKASTTTIVLTNSNANTKEDALVATHEDTVFKTETDTLIKEDNLNISTGPENNEKQQEKFMENISPQMKKLDLPIILSEYLLKETRPLEVFSYDWRNVTFSLYYVFKWLYRKTKKSHKNEKEMVNAIDCS